MRKTGLGQGPAIWFQQMDAPRPQRNRIHVDVAPPRDVDTQAEARRLQAAGAVPADVGQGDATWVVLADPEGNEFCVLSPR